MASIVARICLAAYNRTTREYYEKNSGNWVGYTQRSTALAIGNDIRNIKYSATATVNTDGCTLSDFECEDDSDTPIWGEPDSASVGKTSVSVSGHRFLGCIVTNDVYPPSDSAYYRITYPPGEVFNVSVSANVNSGYGETRYCAITAVYCDDWLVASTFSNVETDNDSTAVPYGEAYSATLSPNIYHTISNVTVLMGGVDVTDSVYDSETHVINIPSVSGDVEINAEAVLAQTTFDLSSLGLARGTYAITAIAKANGYNDSAESNAVSYTTYALSGIWLFNKQINTSIPSNAITFTSNGVVFTPPAWQDYTIRFSMNDDLVYYYNGTTYIAVYNKEGTENLWLKEAYRTVTFDSEQIVSPEFYEWFTANATKQANHTYILSGTWVFNETITRPIFSSESVAFTSGDREYTSINVKGVDDTILTYLGTDAETIVYRFTANVWPYSEYRTITFDGAETVSKTFYDWFIANATQSVGTFQISEDTYSFTPNMTWEQWVNSSYNTGGWEVVTGNSYTYIGQTLENGTTLTVYYDKDSYPDSLISPADTIISNHTYWYNKEK